MNNDIQMIDENDIEDNENEEGYEEGYEEEVYDNDPVVHENEVGSDKDIGSDDEADLDASFVVVRSKRSSRPINKPSYFDDYGT